jgi:hypothetical protein
MTEMNLIPAPRHRGRSLLVKNMLTVVSLLSIFLFSIHLAGDIVRGIEPGTTANLPAVPIMLVWLYGTVALTGTRAGYAIMILGSLLATIVPVLHLRGAGVSGEFAQSDGAFWFIWTLFVLGVTGTFSFILAVRGLAQQMRSSGR